MFVKSRNEVENKIEEDIKVETEGRERLEKKEHYMNNRKTASALSSTHVSL